MQLADRILQLRQRIAEAAASSGRSPDAIRLLAVSKGRGGDDVVQAMDCGLLDFGENYAQEAANKIDSIASGAAVLNGVKPCWHFIGSLQANKTSLVADRCDWIHTVDRGRIAARLNAQRDPDAPPLDICLQVNIDSDPNKSGVAQSELSALAETVLGFPRLRLRGIMAMPSLQGDRRFAFARVRHCLEKLCNVTAMPMDTLSMGTSSDFEDAINEGATVIRIGTALFGSRRNSKSVGIGLGV